jgi:photosystem II stability/assembly factor-like uncharacterized protein
MNKYLIFTIFLAFTISVFSQNWLPAGSVTNPGLRPSISVSSNNIAWIADGGPTTPKIFRTTNGGTTWDVIPTTGITNEIYCLWGMDAMTAFVGEGVVNGNAKLLKTTNGGANWSVILTTGGNNGHFTGLIFTKGNGNLFGVAMAERVYRSSNAGANWVELNAGVVGVSNAQNSLMIVDNDFYGFGLNNGAARVRLTTNNAVSWNTQSIGVVGNYTSAIAFHTNKLLGVAATSTSLPSISRTTDGGTTWNIVDVGAGISGTCYLTWVPHTPVVYILGGNGTIKRSTNNGMNWVTTPTPGVTNLTHFDFFHSGNVVYGYAVSANGNVIKLADTLGILTGVSSHNNIPAEYSLSQNYPNPFNPATGIHFSIAKAGPVKLTVYDALGRIVQELVNDANMNAGSHEISWDAADYTSGIYFYTLETASFRQTKKMLMIK